MDKTISQIKEFLSAALMSYPFIIGLYAAGFFWDLPNDIIGSFDLSEFIFKASVIYLKGALYILVPILFISIIYGPVFEYERKNSHASGDVTEKGSSKYLKWEEISFRGKVRSVIIIILMAAMIAVTSYVEKPPLGWTPDGFGTVFMFLILIGNFSRPFVSENVWIGGRNTCAVLLILLLPIGVGYADAKGDKTSPKVRIGNKICPVIFAGTEYLIFKCAESAGIVPRETVKTLDWPLPSS